MLYAPDHCHENEIHVGDKIQKNIAKLISPSEVIYALRY